MELVAFLLFVLVFYACSASPINKDDFAKMQDMKRALLDSPDTSVTDKIVIINHERTQKGELYEGDIVVTDHDHVDRSTSGDIDGPIKSDVKRNAQRSRQNLWRTRVVPYEIDSAITGSSVTSIKSAIQGFNSHSCLKWIPKRNEDKNWVKIVKKSGCFSSVGKRYWKEGAQELSLGSGCYSTGTIQHEMLHASGFWHEQSRPDRNKYVQVMWENIDKGMAYNFNKYSHGSIDTLNKNYDYTSVMHYGKYGFSKNGLPTLIAVGDPNKSIGQRSGLSVTDVLELNALYDCKTPGGGWSSWGDFSPCDSQCQKHRQRFCTAEDRKTVCPEANLYGIQTEYKVCPTNECNAPVEGHWGRWSSWAACSSSCGDGIKTRTRVCDDPVPKNGGAQCAGSKTENLPCKLRSCNLGPDDCEFESFCHWTQDTSDTSPQPWMMNSGSTSSSGTGPKGDHTSGTGKYIYAEASAPVAPGNTARLLSKTFQPTSGRCMTFWYNMHGINGMGSLNVYVKNANTKTQEKMWGLSGDQGQQWKKASVTIPHSSTNYVVVFESVRGTSFQSDISLDDILFKNGQCTMASLVPTNLPAEVCDFGTQAKTYCTWVNDPTNPKTPDNFYQFNWWTHQGKTPSSSTGPPSGHGGTGYYAYLESSSPYQPGMKGRLISKQYQSSSSMCFDFWYYMFGSNVGTLRVNLETSSSRTNLWSESGDKGETWLHAKVSLSSKSTFNIIVEGTRGSGYLGDIAIDDLRVSYGSCP